jgi:GDP-L-fucose synthase
MKHLGVKFKISYLKNKPNGTMRKVLDVSLAKKYGWKHKTSLKKGLTITIDDYIKRYSL